MDISVPVAREKVQTTLEWEIEMPCDAKNFNWALHMIHKDMEARGINMGYDDAYTVRVSDEAIVFSVIR